MDEDKLHFRTYDLALATALVAHGFSLGALERTPYNDKVSFSFNRSDPLDEVIQAYWADNLSVNPKAYFDILKHLKTRIYSGA